MPNQVPPSPGPNHPFRFGSSQGRIDRRRSFLRDNAIHLKSHGLEDPEERDEPEHLIDTVDDECDEDPFRYMLDPYEEEDDE